MSGTFAIIVGSGFDAFTASGEVKHVTTRFGEPSAPVRCVDFEGSELRTSVGLSAKWFSVIGPIEFSYANPINDQSGDDTRNFQFALGAAF